ncbi:MAG: ketoacyl-ACP synthase III [Bryobacteraceae bacterium]|nr:ketoacyl-ACP synthase III [Bryobacteraceae bacterium]
MAFLRAFGHHLPNRVVDNEEMARIAGCEAEWIVNVSGIEQRRFADPAESVADLAFQAGRVCLDSAQLPPSAIGMIMVASGTSERRFPGPACAVARALGLENIPAIDVPVASAGGLFAIGMANQLAAQFGNVLVIGSEKMSSVVLQNPGDKNTSILFGDGAGACLVSPESGPMEVADVVLCSDGAFAEDLRLEFGESVTMNGRSVIMQASRKIPRAISEVLERNAVAPEDVICFLMHQANQNLIMKVAAALHVPGDRFYSNIARYGNTSSASMLIAASEWFGQHGDIVPGPVCFAAFGAGFHWGALLAIPSNPGGANG